MNFSEKFNAEYYKDEKLDDLVIRRYKSGKKLSEGYHKDGKEIGLWTQWFENGQKKSFMVWKGFQTQLLR